MVKAWGGKYILKILPWSRPLLLELAIGNWKIFITNNKKVSFALLWPAGYVNFTCRGGARPTFCWAWQPAFPLGRASIPDMDPVVNDEVGTERVKSWTFLIRRQICHQIWWTFLWHTLWSLILVTTLAPYLVNPQFGACFVTKFVTKHGDHQIWHQIGWQIHHKIWWSSNISQNQS